MANELIIRTVEGGLCTLALNRPEKLNALNVETFRQLDHFLRAIDPDEVGCVLLTGNGRSFCAGHDLDDLASGAEGNEAARFETNVIEHLASLPMPVVAAVRGHCYTGGLELVLGADIIIAAESAKFADTHTKWDLVPVWGLSQRLPRRVGPHKAKEMMFSARTYSGFEATAMGLANFCLPDDAFDDGVAHILPRYSGQQPPLGAGDQEADDRYRRHVAGAGYRLGTASQRRPRPGIQCPAGETPLGARGSGLQLHMQIREAANDEARLVVDAPRALWAVMRFR